MQGGAGPPFRNPPLSMQGGRAPLPEPPSFWRFPGHLRCFPSGLGGPVGEAWRGTHTLGPSPCLPGNPARGRALLVAPLPLREALRPSARCPGAIRRVVTVVARLGAGPACLPGARAAASAVPLAWRAGRAAALAAAAVRGGRACPAGLRAGVAAATRLLARGALVVIERGGRAGAGAAGRLASRALAGPAAVHDLRGAPGQLRGDLAAGARRHGRGRAERQRGHHEAEGAPAEQRRPGRRRSPSRAGGGAIGGLRCPRAGPAHGRHGAPELLVQPAVEVAVVSHGPRSSEGTRRVSQGPAATPSRSPRWLRSRARPAASRDAIVRSGTSRAWAISRLE